MSSRSSLTCEIETVLALSSITDTLEFTSN